MRVLNGSLLKAHVAAVAAAYFVALAILSVHMGADAGDGGAVAFFAFWGGVIAIVMVPLLAILTLPLTVVVSWAFASLAITHPAAFVAAGATMGIGSLFLLQLLAVVVYGARSGDFDWQRLVDVEWTTASSILPAGAVGGWLIWRSRAAGQRS